MDSAETVTHAGREEGQQNHSRCIADTNQRDQHANINPDESLHVCVSQIQRGKQTDDGEANECINLVPDPTNHGLIPQALEQANP